MPFSHYIFLFQGTQERTSKVSNLAVGGSALIAIFLAFSGYITFEDKTMPSMSFYLRDF